MKFEQFDHIFISLIHRHHIAWYIIAFIEFHWKITSYFAVVNGYVELSHRSRDNVAPKIRATDHHVNDNEPHSIIIRGNDAEWSLELDRRTTEFGKEKNFDVLHLLESTTLVYIGTSHIRSGSTRAKKKTNFNSFIWNF